MGVEELFKKTAIYNKAVGCDSVTAIYNGAEGGYRTAIYNRDGWEGRGDRKNSHL